MRVFTLRSPRHETLQPSPSPGYSRRSVPSRSPVRSSDAPLTTCSPTSCSNPSRNLSCLSIYQHSHHLLSSPVNSSTPSTLPLNPPSFSSSSPGHPIILSIHHSGRSSTRYSTRYIEVRKYEWRYWVANGKRCLRWDWT